MEERVPGGHRPSARRHRPPLPERAHARHRRRSTATRTGSSTTRTPPTTNWSGCGSRARGARRCVEYLQKNHGGYDAIIYFTYLYAPTVLGLQVAPSRAILVPTAHDEPAIHLSIYRDVFSLPAAIAYNTEAERRFLTTHFSIRAVGRGDGGVRRGSARSTTRTPARRSAGRMPAGSEDAAEPDERYSTSHLSVRGATFRRRHRLHKPFVLYGGRIDKGKGCEELIEYFSTFVQEGGDASLVLMGVKLMPLPEEPYINFAGLLSDSERAQALEAATVVVGARRRTRACRCWRSRRSPSARQSSPTRGARCWWITA